MTIAGAAVVISDISDPNNQVFLKGHNGTICSVTMSENGILFSLSNFHFLNIIFSFFIGQFIASGQLGDDADIFVWDFEKKKLVHKLCQHEHGISTMAFTPDGRLLLTVGDFFDRKLFVWDMVSGGIVSNVQLTPTGSSSIHQSGIEKRPPPQVAKISATLVSGSSSSAISATKRGTAGEEGDFVASCWGGHARDIKRRETSDLIFATVGPNVSLWTLTPSTGELRQDKVCLFLSLSFFSILLLTLVFCLPVPFVSSLLVPNKHYPPLVHMRRLHFRRRAVHCRHAER